MPKFKVHRLDVWGHVESDPKSCDCKHECPGYTVNDIYPSGSTIEIENPLDDQKVIAALIDDQYLNGALPMEAFEVDGDPEFMIEVNRKSDGKYLLQLVPE